MPRRLTAYIAWLVAVCAVALAVTSLTIPVDAKVGIGFFRDPTADVLGGIGFWIAITLLSSALPLEMRRGSLVNTSIAPLVVVMAIGGPTAAGWVALLGTTDMREVRGQIPWYGTLSIHAGLTLPAMIGGLVCVAAGSGTRPRPW